MNDGENKVFPIQVSRQELLLFLGAVIVIGTYKNIFRFNAQTGKSVNSLRFQAQLTPDANWRVPSRNTGNRGEVNFPIQVHSVTCYFYYGCCYFYC